MSFRVTEGMMQTQLLTNLFNNEKNLSKDQNMLSTGKKLNKPSDDPVGITYALRYRSELAMNAQYKKNADAATSSLNHVDSVMNQIDDIVVRVKQLTTQGVNGTNNQTSLNSISDELGQLYQQVVNIGNDKFNGNYTFNGQKIDVKPYTQSNAQNENTDSENIKMEIGANISIPLSITGNEVFGSSGDTDNLFKVIKGLKNDFASGNLTGASQYIDKINSRYNTILKQRADIGARQNRVDFVGSRLQDMNTNLTALSSQTEDADVSKVIVQLNQAQNVYQASLSVGAKLIQTSLVNYLK